MYLFIFSIYLYAYRTIYRFANLFQINVFIMKKLVSIQVDLNRHFFAYECKIFKK